MTTKLSRDAFRSCKHVCWLSIQDQQQQYATQHTFQHAIGETKPVCDSHGLIADT